MWHANTVARQRPDWINAAALCFLPCGISFDWKTLSQTLDGKCGARAAVGKETRTRKRGLKDTGRRLSMVIDRVLKGSRPKHNLVMKFV